MPLYVHANSSISTEPGNILRIFSESGNILRTYTHIGRTCCVQLPWIGATGVGPQQGRTQRPSRGASSGTEARGPNLPLALATRILPGGGDLPTAQRRHRNGLLLSSTVFSLKLF